MLYELTAEGKETRYSRAAKPVESSTKIDMAEFWKRWGAVVQKIIDNPSDYLRIHSTKSCRAILRFVITDEAGKSKTFQIYGAVRPGAVLQDQTTVIGDEYVMLYDYMASSKTK